MTEDQLKQAIRLGVPFFTVTEGGDIYARYMPLGPVFRWQKNQMLPMPLQGEDLIWWLQAATENDRDETPEAGQPRR